MLEPHAPPRHRLQTAVCFLTIAAVLLAAVAPLTTVDPDVFHEMALARAACALGRIPTEDLFAFTPTVSPCVHHEWATGMVLYAAADFAGAGGVMVLKYVLIAALCGVCILCARRRGAGLAMLTLCSLVAVSLARIGFTTLRAQVFTLLALALLLLLLDLDRKGRGAWIGLFLPIYVLWLNLHGGFVVGLGVLGVHWLEQVLRQRTPQWRLVLTGTAMAALIVVNPYGWAYYPYLWQGVTMSRPLITEWAPLWHDPDLGLLLPYGLSLALLAYPLISLGPRRLPGVAIVLVCALLAARTTRHLSLYAVAWWCYAPGFLQQTAAAGWLDVFWQRRQSFVLILLGVLSLVCLTLAVRQKPWRLSVPTTEEGPTGGKIVYPAGAVDYLREQDFHGNVLTPFVEGAYVSWRLYPAVKVSLDSRYEVAYKPGLLEEHVGFYQAADGWQETLRRYPTDAVLVRATEPVALLLGSVTGWRRVYRDDYYEVYLRPGLALPVIDRQGQPIEGSFP
jgi:hypothetical protein